MRKRRKPGEPDEGDEVQDRGRRHHRGNEEVEGGGDVDEQTVHPQRWQEQQQPGGCGVNGLGFGLECSKVVWGLGFKTGLRFRVQSWFEV